MFYFKLPLDNEKYNNMIKKRKMEFTYRNAFALNAIHDTKWRTEISEPRGAQFAYRFAEGTF